MPTFAELRARAESAASTARDKSSSFTKPSTKYSPSRPPPPTTAKKPSFLSTPSSSSSSTLPTLSTTTTPPPPRPPIRTASSISREHVTTSQDAVRSKVAPVPNPRTSSTSQPRTKPFSQCDQQDKLAMFAAFDSFFESRFSSSQGSTIAESEPLPPPRIVTPPIASRPVAVPPVAAAPTVALSTRPRLSNYTSSHQASQSIRSYPPPEPYSSSALTLAHYILSDPFIDSPVPNESTWFTSPTNPLPPPLRTRSDHQSSFSWIQRNDEKQFVGVSVFGDLSVVWYRITWSAKVEERGISGWTRDVGREARYRPRPQPWIDGNRLYEASQTYGTRLAEFAREAKERGVPIARGECWDLAQRGLEEVSRQVEPRNQPVPSIGRTHGQLIYWAKVDPAREPVGEWYGGDQYVREGDVVEWRDVKIAQVGMGHGSYVLLGDPEHTAIVTSTGIPSSLPDVSLSPPFSTPYLPSSLTSLTVIEQSLGHAPSESTYDLSRLGPGGFERGGMWIYRPVGMRAFVGIEKVEAKWPEENGVESWGVGDLE